jgi:uncharacterized membrane protein YkoI
MKRIVMTKSNAALVVGLAMLLAPVAAPAEALDPKLKDHDAARQAAQAGEIRSLGEIRSRVGARVGGQFVGSDLNMQSKRYRLRYLREGNVVEVDVDARTGNILSVDGN